MARRSLAGVAETHERLPGKSNGRRRACAVGAPSTSAAGGGRKAGCGMTTRPQQGQPRVSATEQEVMEN